MLVPNLLSWSSSCTGSLSWLPAAATELALLFLPSAPVPNRQFLLFQGEGSGGGHGLGVLRLGPPVEPGRARLESGEEGCPICFLNEVQFPDVVPILHLLSAPTCPRC